MITITSSLFLPTKIIIEITKEYVLLHSFDFRYKHTPTMKFYFNNIKQTPIGHVAAKRSHVHPFNFTTLSRTTIAISNHQTKIISQYPFHFQLNTPHNRFTQKTKTTHTQFFQFALLKVNASPLNWQPRFAYESPIKTPILDVTQFFRQSITNQVQFESAAPHRAQHITTPSIIVATNYVALQRRDMINNFFRGHSRVRGEN